jgi:hypothetical protein
LILVKGERHGSSFTTDEWINKMWYLYAMEFYPATMNNEVFSFAGKWMEQRTSS